MKLIFSFLVMLLMSVWCYAQCPPENQCTYTVEMDDSYGDGWNGASLLVMHGSTPVDTITCGYTNETASFTVCADSAYSLLWSSGNFDDEASFTVFSPSGHAMYTCANCDLLSGSFSPFVGCNECYPPSVQLNSMSNSTTSFSWHPGTATTWDIIAGPLATTSTGSTATTVTDSFYVMQNLALHTEYILYFRTVCDITNNQFSDWDSLTFTYIDLQTLPFTCDFETASDSLKWVKENDVNNWFMGADTANTTTNHYLYVSDDNGFTNSYSSYYDNLSFVYTNIVFGTANDYILSLDWKAFGEHNYDHLLVCLVPLHISLEVSGTDEPSWVSDYQLDVLDGENSWQNQSFLIQGSAVNGTTQRLVLVWQNDGYDTHNPPAAVDNISVMESPCPVIDSMKVTNLSINSADILAYSQNTTNFVLYYKSEVDTAYTAMNISANPSYNLNNLMPGTRYFYYLKSDCGNGAYGFPSEVASFITECQLITTFPWNESFENEWTMGPVFPSTDAAPICWQNFNYGYSQMYYRWSEEELLNQEAHSGSRVARFYGGYSTDDEYLNNDWLLTPIMSLTGGQKLNFYAKVSSTDTYYGDDLAVYIINVSDSDVTSFSSLTANAAILMNNVEDFTEDWSFFEVSLAQYTGNYRIAFVRNHNPAGSYLYLDDVSVSAMPDCPMVYNLQIVPSSATALAVSFSTLNGVGNGWDIAYAPTSSSAPFDPEVATTVNVSSGASFPVIIDNLTQGIDYTFAVRQSCGGAWSDTLVTSIPANEQFVTIPYSCGFESAVENTPWVLVNGINSNQWMIGSDAASSGDSSLYISDDSLHNNYSSSYYDGYSMVASYVDVQFGSAEQYVLSFDWRANGEGDDYAYDYLTVCLVPYNVAIDFTSTYEAPAWVQRYRIAERLRQQINWQNQTVVIDGSEVNNTVMRLVFYWHNNYYLDNNPAAAVDNITITETTCSAPTEVTATATAVDATISWSSQATEWIVSLLRDGTWVDTMVTDNPFILSGLTPNTDYQVRVYALCNGGADTSMFMNTVSFTTECSFYLPPFAEDFSSGDVPPTDCWSQANGTLSAASTLSYGSSEWSDRSSELIVGGGNHIVLNQYDDNNGWLISPSINLGDGSTMYQVSFDVQLTAYGYSSIGGYPDTTNSDDRFAMVVSTDNGDTWLSSHATIWDNDTSAHVLNSLAGSAHHIEIPLTDASGNPYSGLVKIAIFAESVIENADNDIHVDNFAVGTLANCVFPEDMIVDNISQASADISWTPGSDELSWEIIVAPYGTNIDTLVPITVQDTFYQASNLTENTKYVVYVRAICASGSGYSSYISTSFTTLCNAVIQLPYTENFDAYTVTGSTLPDCWFAPIMFGTAPYVTSYNSSSAPNAFFFKSATTIPTTATTPQMAADIHALQVTFQLKAEDPYYSGTFDVGVMSDPSDVSTFESVQIITPPDYDYHEYTVYFNQTALTGANNFIAFRQHSNTSYSYYWLDDVVVDSIPSCITPANVTAGTATATTSSITIEWTETGTATAWNIEYGPTGFTQGTGTIVPATANPYPVTGLLPGTAYDFYVRADCGGGDVSAWSNVVTASTTCETIAAFPYTEDFENAGNMPNCWSQNYVSDNVDWDFIDGDHRDISSAHGGSYNALFYYDDNETTHSTKLVSPVFDLTQTTNPYASFWHTQAAWGNDQDELTVYYRTNATATWTQLTQYTSDITAWTFDSLALPNPSATYQLAFEGTAAYGHGIAIDDITIASGDEPVETCPMPTNLAVTAVTDNSATLSWTQEAGTATEWTLNYRRTAEGVDWTTSTISTNPYTIADLADFTSYEVQIRANCPDGTFSEYTDIVTFTTTGIDEYNLSNSISLYPNPTTSYLDVKFSDNIQVSELKVYDVYGKLLQTIAVNENPTRINVSDFADGVYFVRAITQDGIANKSFIKR